MAHPDISLNGVPAIAPSAASPVVRPVFASGQEQSGGGDQQYGSAAQSGQSSHRAAEKDDAACRPDTTDISVDGLRAQLNSIHAEIVALAARGSDDPQNAGQLTALQEQAATISMEIEQAASSIA